MPSYEANHLSVAYRSHNEDRCAIIHDESRTVIVVADGAGGSGSGERAAERVIAEVREHYRQLTTSADWDQLLTQIDYRLGAGESTAVVVDIRQDGICGASVGDSVAWLWQDDELRELTQDQIRKPLLGSGEAQPQGFEHSSLDGMLIVASDGLGNYLKRDVLTRTISQADFYEIPRRLIELVRLPSGEYWDDTTVVVCRLQPRRRSRQRYEIE
ncbi:protein phosphatase 2C domain-containing protein [Anatilimnocola floriformis]|uniref:protein phosphatase 2C domain-containing protein n=1 Tax=Anatilimnocola floriformis TaxID=2948575 RepID=UPI0020C2F09E|nr:protein phosphatase 2C domain-containing protein [Anatilimnocola floriformis]